MNLDPGLISARFAGFLGDFSLDVAFEVPMRGIAALFGPSGSGKTTILQCMAGLRRMEGRLSVGGEVWQDDSEGVFRRPYERSVGYVFQEASLFPHLTVRRNLLYGAKRAGRNRPSAILSFDDAVDLLGIGGLVDRSPSALSGGERQRVAIGRALLSQPRLLLMDEPLSGLDQNAREEILPYLETLHHTLAVPILYVSHEIREVARLADTIILLSAGRPAFAGPIREVLEQLDLAAGEDEFETGVVLRARVITQDRKYWMTRLDHHGQEISIPSADLDPGQEVRLRIRARDVALATEKPSSISVRNVLAGTVLQVVENPGTAFVEVLVDVGGGRLRARVTRDATADLRLAAGQTVYALIKSISFDRPALASAPAPDRGPAPS